MVDRMFSCPMTDGFIRAFYFNSGCKCEQNVGSSILNAIK